MVEVSILGSPVRATWYDIWSLATSAVAICARRGVVGVGHRTGRFPVW